MYVYIYICIYMYIYIHAIMQHSTGTARSVGTLYLFNTFDILCHTKLELPTHVHVIQLRNLAALWIPSFTELVQLGYVPTGTTVLRVGQHLAI